MITVVILFHVVGFVSSIDAVMGTRTAQGAIAWAVSLNTFPYVAVPAYWFLGRSRFQGYINARREGDSEIRQIILDAREKTMAHRSKRGEDDPLVRAGKILLHTPSNRGKSVVIF